jgi:sigma-E factor negative regulatory protein RseC
MLSEEVSRSGIVQEIGANGKIKVSIISKAQCVSCQLNNSCSSSDVKEKVIEIDNFGGVLKIGEMVDVSLKESAGFKALFLGYILPFLILFITLIIASEYSNDELFVGLLSLSTLIPYYLTIYLLQNVIKKEFSFFVHKQN